MPIALDTEHARTAQITSLVAGAPTPADGPIVCSFDPWSGAPVARAVQADEITIHRAIDAAVAAERRYGGLSWIERGGLLTRAGVLVRERASTLTDLAVREVGKPIAEARAEVARTAEIIEFYAAEAARPKGEVIPSSEAGVAILTRRRSIGTTLVITPWNFPFAIPAWKIAPALLCGNPVIWKPATAAMACAHALARCFLDAGFPEDVLALLLGAGSAIEPVLDAPLAAVSFTGSTAVGHRIRERVAPRGVRVQLELGGKNVAVVLDDADPECAQAIARAAYSFAGQKCTATSIVLATPAIHDELADRLAAITRSVPWGNPRDEHLWGGPVINSVKRDQIDAMLVAAQGEGAALLPGGRAHDRAAVLAPTLMRASSRAVNVAHEEVFGPVLTILDAQDAATLAAVANETEYGLVASVFGRDIDAIRVLVNQLDVGLIAINRLSTGLEVQAPNGGWKESGDGEPEQGQQAVRFFTNNQTLYWKSNGPEAVFP